jgi:hypothetical protein
MTLEQATGAALVLLFLADIFLTVLYARAGTGLLAPYWTRAVWLASLGVARVLGRRRGAALSLAGPLIVVSLIGFWSFGLTLGAALVIRPELGTAIRPSSGDTPTDLVTALLVAGNSLSIVGSGDFAPHTTATRLLYLANSLIGASVLSLVLSYLVQVYSALRERNALALTIDLMTGGTGDAATMLARLLPEGETDSATSELGNLVGSLAAIKEAHHFYPLLVYFRFDEPRYAVSRVTFVLLDLTALIEELLDPRRYGSVIHHVAVDALRRGAGQLLATLDRDVVGGLGRPQHAEQSWRLRQRYLAASTILTNAHVAVRADRADRYAAGRLEWEPAVDRVAAALGYATGEVGGDLPAR